MADNTQVGSGSGDIIRDKDRSGVKTQIVALDLNPSGSESLMAGVMPVSINAGTNAIGKVAPTPASTGTLSSVAGTVVADTQLLAANSARLGAIFYNDSTSDMWLSLGTVCGPTLTPTTFTIKIAAGGYYELTAASDAVYTGKITGTWASATGSARVTELTA